MNYAMPSEVKVCVCQESGPMAMMFCKYGHMTECHFPLDCHQAACGHLPKYDDFSPAQLDSLEESAKSLLAILAEVSAEGMDRECQECGGKGWFEKAYTIPSPFPAGVTMLPAEIEVKGVVICICAIKVALALESAGKECELN